MIGKTFVIALASLLALVSVCDGADAPKRLRNDDLVLDHKHLRLSRRMLKKDVMHSGDSVKSYCMASRERTANYGAKSEKLFQGDRQVGNSMSSSKGAGHKRDGKDRTINAKAIKSASYDTDRTVGNGAKSEKMFQGDRQAGMSMPRSKGADRKRDDEERTVDAKASKSENEGVEGRIVGDISIPSRVSSKGDDGKNTRTGEKRAKAYRLFDGDSKGEKKDRAAENSMPTGGSKKSNAKKDDDYTRVVGGGSLSVSTKSGKL